MVETIENPIHAESHFGGRCKYGKGRRLQGDIVASQVYPEDFVAEVLSDSGNDVAASGEKIKGPWVFGLYANSSTARFFLVPDRRGVTLSAIIQRYVEPGSVIVTDEVKRRL